MNLFDSSFLCLDIGSTGVRGISYRIKSGRVAVSAIHSVDSFDTVFAIKSVVDELERQTGARFDSAHITGNFGNSDFKMFAKTTNWSNEHRITAMDIKNQTDLIRGDNGFNPIHIIPLRYDTASANNLMTPIGIIDRQLVSVFGCIFYEEKKIEEIFESLRQAHIQIESLFDPSFLLNDSLKNKNQNTLFFDLGAQYTTVSIWTVRGPVFFQKIQIGQNDITDKISETLGITSFDAERIKKLIANVKSEDMDRFTPADSAYDFSRADLNEIILPILLDIVGTSKEMLADVIEKYKPTGIIISGGGSNITGIEELFENWFGLSVLKLGTDAAVRALADNIWGSEIPRAKRFLARREKIMNRFKKITSVFKKKKTRSIPIMPSSLSFNLKNPDNYNLFNSGGISFIHVDIMDGFYVDRITGGIDELKIARQNTNAHLYVHLMTESPVVWAAAAANAGADTIIVSTGTAGVRTALRKIHEMGKRCGIAINPETSIDILKPVLKEIDDILIMSVKPGNGGQEFDESVLIKISTLANTRKKYGLKYRISVDGGINPDNAKLCWAAGADLLVCGTYLANSDDFPLAVQSLLPY